MLPVANGHRKSSGKVAPINGDLNGGPGYKTAEQEIEAVNFSVAMASDSTDPTREIAKKSFFAKLFSKDKNEKKGDEVPVPEKKPPGPKLKMFQIVCFLFHILSIVV